MRRSFCFSMRTYAANEQLAQNYLSLMDMMRRVTSQHHRYAATIATAPIDIPAYYHALGGLGKFELSGLGRDAKEALQALLRKGTPGALRTLRDIQATRLEARLG